MDLTKYKDMGDLFLPTEIRDFLETYLIGSDKSVFYVSIWSIIHLISGIFTGYYLIDYKKYAFKESLYIGFILHTMWEFWQYIITNTPRSLRGLVDTIVDTVLFMFGIYIYKIVV